MSLAGQYWFSIVSILAWWQVTILNISTGLWWFADRIRGSCELAHWFGFVYIVYIIFLPNFSFNFLQNQDVLGISQRSRLLQKLLSEPELPIYCSCSPLHCCLFQHSFDYILYWDSNSIWQALCWWSLLEFESGQKKKMELHWLGRLGLGNLEKVASHRWAPSDFEKLG